MKGSFDIFKLPVYVHLLMMAILTCIIVFVVLKSIDAYTNHNQAVSVPDVRKLQIEEAIPFLEKNMLRYSIIDSIYRNDITPGAIVEMSPEANSKVKRNRMIYITINAKTEETAFIPEFGFMSYRQAYALLKARGFKNVEWKYVTGDFRDLAIGVEYGGKVISGGTKVPLTAYLILLVGDGNIAVEGDSLTGRDTTEIFSGESWF